MTAAITKSRPREANLFRNNRIQAVRIPAEFELPGDRVLIRREGTRRIIEPVRTEKHRGAFGPTETRRALGS